MKINLKKSGKLIVLLLSSLIIAVASAQVYRYMYIDGGVIVGSAKMIWIEGAEAPSGTSIDGSTASLNLSVEAGTPINFTEVLFLKNDNLTGSFNILVNITTAVLSADFAKCEMHIYQNSSGSFVYVDTLDLTSSTDYYSGTLAAQNYLRMDFDVEATTTASGFKPFDVQVRYD